MKEKHYKYKEVVDSFAVCVLMSPYITLNMYDCLSPFAMSREMLKILISTEIKYQN